MLLQYSPFHSRDNESLDLQYPIDSGECLVSGKKNQMIYSSLTVCWQRKSAEALVALKHCGDENKQKKKHSKAQQSTDRRNLFCLTWFNNKTNCQKRSLHTRLDSEGCLKPQIQLLPLIQPTNPLASKAACQEEALTVIIPLAWEIGQDNFHAAIWSIIRSLAFFSIVMPDAVSISFIKLKSENKQ